jgi:hypothetical protein
VQKWQTREGEREERLKNNARFAEEIRRGKIPALVSAVGRRQAEIEAIPQSAPMQEWNRAETTGDALSVLARHPVDVLANLAASGLTSGAASVGLGAVGSAAGPAGTMTGAGLGSFATEYGGKIIEEIRAAGGDFVQPETVMAVLGDPAKLANIREKAAARGVPVAVLDAISAGIAGKLVTSPAKSLLGKVGQGAAEMGVQGALGGAGEVAGSLAAGDPVSGKAVIEEMLGEVGGGAVEVATGAVRSRAMPGAKPAEAAQPAGLARLLSETAEAEKTNEAAVPEATPSRDAATQSEESASEVFTSGPMKKPRLGQPAEAVAAAINARPVEQFKADLGRM